MTQVTSARLLPQKPSRWAKILLNRKVPILLFFLLELAFLVFLISQPTRAFPIHYLMGTLVECLYLLLLAQSFHGFSFQTVLADYHCPLSQFLGRPLLYFSLADLGVRRLKKRLEDATVQASDHLSTDPEVADYLSHSDRQLQKFSLFSGA